ncbi:MAG: SLBB domain-containing protein, partial [Chitinophagales bacterium]
MKTSYHKIIWSLLLFFTCNCAFAQFGDLYNPRKSRDSNQYNRYDIEELLKSADESGFGDEDTTDIKNQLLTTPNELRKLGVSEEMIEELIQLNTEGDSVSVAKYEAERRLREEELGEAVDSFSYDEVLELIEIRKRQILEKALKLPEPTIYGHEFFRRTVFTPFGELEEMRPPPNYQLATNDEITVIIWGQKDFNKVYVIDDLGAINPILVGRINLKGITYEKAKEIIKDRFAQTFDIEQEKIEVAVSYSRVITANFVGNLFNPGGYRFPAQTSIIDALVMIDGPNAIGSMREIYIERNGQRIESLDIYNFLNKPDSRQNFFLQENDYIVVPSLRNLVNISGKIRRPHNYEMKNGEGLRDLIEFAGGLDAGAFTRTLSIKRYHKNKEVLLDINLDSLMAINKDIPLVNGDSVFVYSIPKELRNYVEVIGAVNVPGRYQLRKNERISDVLMRAEGILDDADRSRAYVKRLKDDLNRQIISFNLDDVLLTDKAADNILLRNLDTIHVLSRKEFRQDFAVSILGAVRKTGEYPFAENLTLKDLIYLSGGLQKEAANERIEVSRMVSFSDEYTGKAGTQRVVVKRIDIGKDLTFEEAAEDFELQPYDQVFVRFNPNFEPQETVKIFGEIMYPGEYPLLNKNERIVDVIDRAGGFTNFAFRQGAQMYRIYDSTGVVLLDLEKAFKKPDKSRFNYLMAGGDSIFIPEIKNIVTMMGATGYSDVDTIPRLSVPYEGPKRADYYLRRYGAGFGRYAKKSRTFVRKPSGQTKRTLNLGIIKLYPKVENGAIVYVDATDRKKNELLREERRENLSWNDAFDSVTAKLAT